MLPGHSEFLAEFHNEYVDGGSLFQSVSAEDGMSSYYLLSTLIFLLLNVEIAISW